MYLGIDVGSVSTNIILLDSADRVIEKIYLRTQGQPITALKTGLSQIASQAADDEILGVGVTGSGRRLAGVIVGADVVKNEITAHSVAAIRMVPNVSTVLEIGGQDSKLIIIRNGVVVDFAMNTVCAAGTGSFLDQQAARIGVPIERFGSLSTRSSNPVRIAGRCAVFAESDMIHKQQLGHRVEDIIAGLCEALVRNYLNNLGKGKDLLPAIVFQGGVAANEGMKRAFESSFGQKVIVPEYYDVMGALGAALLAKELKESEGYRTGFRGFDHLALEHKAGSFSCDGCSNLCEVVEVKAEGAVIARWGDRCGKWQSLGVGNKQVG